MDEKVKFLENLFGRKCKFNSSSKEFITFCPFCNHYKPKLYLNVEKDVFNCFKCDTRGKDLYPIIKKIGTQEHLDQYNKEFKSKFSKDKQQKVEFEKIHLPQEFVPLYNNESVVAKRVKKYLIEERKIKEKDILRYKLGTAYGGKYEGMVIFPSFDVMGEVNYFIARPVSRKGYYIPPTDKGYKNSIIVNEYNLDFSKPILIVEGFIDAIKSEKDNVVPLLGSSLSKDSKLFGQIIKNKTQIYLGLDPDAIKKTMWLAKNFINNCVDVYYVDIGSYKDIGEMESGIFDKYFCNAKKLSEMDLLRMKIRYGVSDVDKDFTF